MGIAVSFASSIVDLWQYRRTRFPLALFVPLAGYLTLAASVTDPPSLVVAGRVGLALLWLLQFRLADDLADRERDRVEYPDRVLSRADARPFVVLLVLITVGNVFLSGVWFLALTVGFALWYAVRPRWPQVNVVVLLKYPAFVYLLNPDHVGPNLLVHVLATFVAYEVLHDVRLRPVPGSTVLLALSLLSMPASVGIAEPVLLPGCLLLAWLFLRHHRHRPPKLWPYTVFLVSCVWISRAIRW